MRPSGSEDRQTIVTRGLAAAAGDGTVLEYMLTIGQHLQDTTRAYLEEIARRPVDARDAAQLAARSMAEVLAQVHAVAAEDPPIDAAMVPLFADQAAKIEPRTPTEAQVQEKLQRITDLLTTRLEPLLDDITKRVTALMLTEAAPLVLDLCGWPAAAMKKAFSVDDAQTPAAFKTPRVRSLADIPRAVARITDALSAGKITSAVAGRMLYSLQLAAQALKLTSK